MFIRGDEDLPHLRPSTSEISPNDWRVLSRYWYPVAVEGDVKRKPLPSKLLDVNLVIYRVEDAIAVALDICPHRNIRLSIGDIVDDRLVCAFHGLAFNAKGQCTRIPCLRPDAKLPPSYRLTTFRSVLRYGLVWVCLDDESSEQIPMLPRALEVGLDRLGFAVPRDWPVGAPHQIENYLDIAHLPFVHSKTIGGDRNFVPPVPRIEQTSDGLVVYARSDHAAEGGRAGLFDYVNTIHLPFCVYTDGQVPEGSSVLLPSYQMWNIAAPSSAHTCRVFWMFVLSEPSSTRESRPAPSGGDEIGTEDIRVLTHLMRADYPLDQKGQIHIPVDNISIEYRKSLRNLGLARS